MSYQALYRRFRPKTFADVKGQDAIVTTLRNQISSGRIGHAYLFTGTRGTGKTTVAKIFARAVNCQSPAEDGSPCGNCDICKGIADGTLLNVIEIDAATNNGVESIRTIINEVAYSPTKGKYKIYIIDEAHMLSGGTGGAFNALLKTLEEPPSYVIFILATTEVNKIPITILSRCQRYDFRRMSIDTMTARMKELTGIEGTQADEQALRFIARIADGSMRDALSLLDQCLAFHFGERLTYDKALDVLGAVDQSVYTDFMDRIIKQDLPGAVRVLDDQIMRGRELGAFVSDLIWYMRNMLLLSSSGSSGADIADVLGISTDTLEELKTLSAKTDPDTLMRYIRICSELLSEIRYSPQKRVLTEIAVVRMMRPQMQEDLLSLTQRVAQAERKLNRIEAEGVKVRQSDKTEEEKPQKKVPVPEALPEDVKLAVENWNRLISHADNTLKGFLDQTVPSTDGTVLVIKANDFIVGDVLRSEENTELLNQLFVQQLKKKVEFRVIDPSEEEKTNTNYPDLSELIKADIETVEDKEDEE